MNYLVTAASGLKIRAGAGIEYEELTLPEDRLRLDDIIIGAGIVCDPAWLTILMEDESVGYVARQWVQAIPENGRAIEAVEIALPKYPALPIFQNQLVSLYGYPKERAGYLITIDLREFAPYLAHVRDYNGNPWSCRVYGHEALAGPLKYAFQLICSRGLAAQLHTYDGCFCIRPMTIGKRPSIHSWGMGPDLNARTNPFTSPDSESWPKVVTDFSPEFVNCFATAGFEWGGLWQSCHDAMHFQLPWTQDWRGSDNPLAPKVSQ